MIATTAPETANFDRCGSMRKALPPAARFKLFKQPAIDAALTVLRVDQIIMSKPAGGGKMKDARMGQV